MTVLRRLANAREVDFNAGIWTETFIDAFGNYQSLPTIDIDSSGNIYIGGVQVGGGGGGGTPGGDNGNLQYNNSGAFGGIAGSALSGSGFSLFDSVSGTTMDFDPSSSGNGVFMGDDLTGSVELILQVSEVAALNLYSVTTGAAITATVNLSDQTAGFIVQNATGDVTTIGGGIVFINAQGNTGVALSVVGDLNGSNVANFVVGEGGGVSISSTGSMEINMGVTTGVALTIIGDGDGSDLLDINFHGGSGGNAFSITSSGVATLNSILNVNSTEGVTVSVGANTGSFVFNTDSTDSGVSYFGLFPGQDAGNDNILVVFGNAAVSSEIEFGMVGGASFCALNGAGSTLEINGAGSQFIFSGAGSVMTLDTGTELLVYAGASVAFTALTSFGITGTPVTLDDASSISDGNSLHLLNQTGGSSGTLFTPTQLGVFLISYCLFVGTPGLAGTAELQLAWPNGSFTSASLILSTSSTVSGTELVCNEGSTGNCDYTVVVAGASGGPHFNVDVRILPLG
jgi:hypothetical protein